MNTQHIWKATVTMTGLDQIQLLRDWCASEKYWNQIGKKRIDGFQIKLKMFKTSSDLTLFNCSCLVLVAPSALWKPRVHWRWRLSCYVVRGETGLLMGLKVREALEITKIDLKVKGLDTKMVHHIRRFPT